MRYLEIVELLKQKNIKIFRTRDLENLLGISNAYAKNLITRYWKRGLISRVKKGLYYIKDFSPSTFEIATHLYKPSYISLNSALSKYSLIPEVSYSITSVTSRYTREYNANNLSYSYRRVKLSAFTGYVKENGYLIALPEKAVADYLYFVSLKKIPFNDRLSLKDVDKSKVIEYTKLFGSKALDAWMENNYDRQANRTESIN